MILIMTHDFPGHVTDPTAMWYVWPFNWLLLSSNDIIIHNSSYTMCDTLYPTELTFKMLVLNLKLWS